MTPHPRRSCLGPVLPALLSLWATGCGGCGTGESPDAYPAHIAFSDRVDVIVEKLPPNAPSQHVSDGKMEEGIRAIGSNGGRVLDPVDLPEHFRRSLAESLKATFGSPGHPRLKTDAETLAIAESLGLTPERLQHGSRLFRRLCQDCHGVSGDGRGTSAAWMFPHPRDYRSAVFKFVSTPGTAARKPSRTDLARTLQRGLKNGSAMPSFANRSDQDREYLVDYVVFLSVRGRVEMDVMREALLDPGVPVDPVTTADEALQKQLREWVAANTATSVVGEFPKVEGSTAEDSLRRGHRLFVDAKGAGCAACHEDFGRRAKWQYDVWGTLVKPAELTHNRRKGGDEPTDLFHRIRGGIGPAMMPAVTGLDDSAVWDLVRFLQALPYPERLPDDVRTAVYGK